MALIEAGPEFTLEDLDELLELTSALKKPKVDTDTMRQVTYREVHDRLREIKAEKQGQ